MAFIPVFRAQNAFMRLPWTLPNRMYPRTVRFMASPRHLERAGLLRPEENGVRGGLLIALIAHQRQCFVQKTVDTKPSFHRNLFFIGKSCNI